MTGFLLFLGLVLILGSAAFFLQQQAQEAENRTAATQYDTVVQCKEKGIAEATCVLLYGINSGNVPYLTPDGGSVVLPEGTP